MFELVLVLSINVIGISSNYILNKKINETLIPKIYEIHDQQTKNELDESSDLNKNKLTKDEFDETSYLNKNKLTKDELDDYIKNMTSLKTTICQSFLWMLALPINIRTYYNIEKLNSLKKKGENLKLIFS